MSHQLKPFRLTVCVAILGSLPFVSGCETDKLVFFEDGLVTGKEMKPFLGKYAVERYFDTQGPKTILVKEEDGRYFFSGATRRDDVKKYAFLLSKIPNSKLGLHLLSLPPSKEIHRKMFAIGRVHEGKTYLWVVFDKDPVAKGRIAYKDGKFRSEDVKAFLEKFADAYVLANDPVIVLKKSK